MEARLAEVQKKLLRLLLVSLALALLVRPEAGNRRYADALRELEAFRTGFTQHEAEATLRAQAQAQAGLSLPALVATVQDKRGPRLKLAEDARAPSAVASLHLATLAEAQRLARADASLSVGVPDAAALGSSIAWRMARSPRAGAFTLHGITLIGAEVSAQEADLDSRVGELRSKSLAARAAIDDATRKVSAAERRVEKRAKRHSRSLDKAQAQLESARAGLDEKTRLHAAAQVAYDDAAGRADQPHKRAAFGPEPQAALAQVQLSQAGERIQYEIPVRLVARSVAVPGVRGAEFAALQAAGLWDEVKGLSASAASTLVQSRFNWHLRTVELLGITFSGAKLLQLVPCVVPVLLALLFLQMRRAETFYSPFTTKVPNSLPRVGFRHRSLEFAALVLAPLLAPMFACIALVLVQQLPLLPLLSALCTLMLGVLSFVKLEDLRRQAISIVRSHSYPPPAADLSPFNLG